MPEISAAPPARPKRVVTVNLSDAHLGIWQDDPNDPTFRSEIFGPLIRLLRAGGWVVGPDPRIHYRSLRPTHRLAKRHAMRAAVAINGRAIDLNFWSEAAVPSNPNGRRHDFDRRRRAPYLDRLRMDHLVRRTVAWLRERATVTIEDRRDCGLGNLPGQITAAAFVATRRAKCWHTDLDLGRARYANSDSRASGDGLLIDDGTRVWFVGPKGRILAGTAHYDLNDRWIVTVGRYGLHFLSCWEIFVGRPPDLRRKRNERARRAKLEREIANAIRRDDFARAALLRRILFGEAPTYLIWSLKNGLYYRSNCSGYTSDAIDAGRYTREEAEDEVRRVPHLLELVMPDGGRVKAADLDRARAA